MNTLLRLTLFSLALSLVGCASTDFQAIESQGPIVAQGVAGTRKVVDGVDIWTSGSPPRKYQVIGVIEDKRGGGVLPMYNTSTILRQKCARQAAMVPLSPQPPRSPSGITPSAARTRTIAAIIVATLTCTAQRAMFRAHTAAQRIHRVTPRAIS
jgi:hypothetical protein